MVLSSCSEEDAWINKPLMALKLEIQPVHMYR